MTRRKYTVPGVAERWMCNDDFVYQAIQSGKLRATKPARRWLIDEADIEAFEQASKNAPPDEPQRRRRRRRKVA